MFKRVLDRIIQTIRSHAPNDVQDVDDGNHPEGDANDGDGEDEAEEEEKKEEEKKNDLGNIGQRQD